MLYFMKTHYLDVLVIVNIAFLLFESMWTLAQAKMTLAWMEDVHKILEILLKKHEKSDMIVSLEKHHKKYKKDD